MKLNKQGKDELRAQIVEKLVNVPKGQRVHLDKELLEDLLFEEIVYNKETGGTVKLPIWSGDFLSKIDLSEISFENVAWDLVIDKMHDTGYDKEFDDETWKKFNNDSIYSLPNGVKVNYSNTNAKIDFSKAWKGTKKYFNIIDCDFSGVDLSNNDMSMVGCIFNSNLANTGIIIPPELKGVSFGNVDFSGVDLSKWTINGKILFLDLVGCVFDNECNLSNTRINIIINPDEMIDETPQNKYFLKTAFKEMLDEGLLVGCYINGKLISSMEEKQVAAQEKRDDYEKMKEDLISKVTNSIDQQINGFSR